MATYQGHKNWDYWNVSLWIGNDEGLYRSALDHKRRAKNNTEAATRLLSDLEDMGITHTPDGAKYTMTTLRAAIMGLE